MTNNSITSNLTITGYEQYLLAGWKAFGDFPAAATKTVPVTLHIVGILANTNLLIYLIHSRKCRLAIFALLTSLAMCDWSMSFCTIIFVLFIMPNLTFVLGARQVCWAILYIAGISYATSTCHVMALAALRFYQLVYPLHSKVHVTTGRVVKCCLGIWIFCAAVTIQYPLNYAITPVPHNDKTLLIWHFVGNAEAKEIFLNIFQQGIPLVVVVLLHLIKLFIVTKASQISESERRSPSFKTVRLLIMCFVLSILPRFLHMSQITQLTGPVLGRCWADAFGIGTVSARHRPSKLCYQGCYHMILGYPYHAIHTALYMYMGIILSGNCVVNPFLYLLSSNEIRQDICNMVRLKGVKKT